MSDITVPSVALSDGARIPQLGLGVYKVADDEANGTPSPPADFTLEAGT